MTAADNSVYVGNYFSDAVHESVNRWDNNGTVGGATNVTYALNRVARSYGDKSAVEVRSLTNGVLLPQPGGERGNLLSTAARTATP